MQKLLKDAEKIKSLEIQGASNVALSAINFLSEYAHRIGKSVQSPELLEKLIEAGNILSNTRATEPAMRNGLNYIINNLKKEEKVLSREKTLELISHCEDEFKLMIENAKMKIAEIGARRIPLAEAKNEFIVMTHCHSSIVNGILLEAKKQGKDNFKVVATETQPRLQGRKTVNKLNNAGIEVIHVIDSAMRWVVNNLDVDLIIIGADSITSEGTIINKIGSRLLALVAHEEHVPFYVASSLLKYNPQTSFGILEKIEMREPKEIWETPPEGVNILNPAFETVSRRYIDGLITEAGIFASSHVHNYFAKLYPDML
ncbi:MAG: translation initiation factor eIF-2B [Candidatus Thorarchaeota archaeon]